MKNKVCNNFIKKNMKSVGISVIAVGILMLFYMNHANLREKNQQVEMEKNIALVERQIEIKKQLKSYSEKIKNLEQFGSRVAEVETQAVGAAQWLGMLVEEFEETGGSIESTEILNGRRGSLMTRVRVRLSGRIDLEGLRQFLYRIELGGRLLDVERLVLGLKDSTSFPGQLSIVVVVGSYVKLPALSE